MELQRPRPLYEQVYKTLKAAILAGEIPFGERINEVQIAQNLKVSRGPVRESVQRLEQEGLLVRDKRNQLSIFQPTHKDVVDIYQCRKVLESLAAELTATKITEEEKREFKNMVDETAKLLSKTDKKRFVDLNSDFHNFIIKISDNSRLQSQLTQLRTLTYFYRQYSARGEVRKKKIFEEHRVIYEAIVAHDVKKAGMLMGAHIESDLEHLITIFEEEVNDEKV